MCRCIVVLGMHRSGTSCATRMLHHLGVYLGDNVDDEPAPTNLTGHWEARDVVPINDEILALSGGTWNDVPEQLTWNLECDEKMKRVLALFALQPLYGWKDPRTTITFPAWKRHLPEHVVLACIRHPLAVAQSLEVRDGFDLERGLRLWTDYNRHLLHHLSSEREVHWFPYDEPQEVLHAHLRRLCASLHLPFREDVGALFNPYLRHDRAGYHPAAADAMELYRTLRAMSRKSLSDHSPLTRTPELPADSIADDCATNDETLALAARERNLEEVLRNFSVAQQRYWRVVYEGQRVTAENLERVAEERLAREIERATAERQRIAALEQRLARVETSWQRITATEQRLARVESSGQRIAALEQRLARVESSLQRSAAAKLLARVPGLRPVYHMARRVFHVTG